MVIITPILKSIPYLIGTWTLRSTNDIDFSKTLTYLEFNYDSTIKLKTIYQDGIIGKKLSRSGEVTLIDLDDSKIGINIKYNTFNTYSFSICGIKIPEIKVDSLDNKIIKKKLTVEHINKCLIINDDRSDKFYIFDLAVNKPEPPFVDIYLNTFLFTQITSFILNIIFAKIFHSFFY
jgi:hypothetical protein